MKKRFSVVRRKKIRKLSEEMAVIYRFMHHKWHDSDETPTAEEIEELICYLMNQIKEDEWTASSWGVTVEKYDWMYDVYYSREYHDWI